jgi:nucleoside-diphosphate-sugar epimerase
LTGATGYIGSRIASRLLSRGYSVTGLARSEAAKQNLEKRGMNAVIGDLAQPESFLDTVSRTDAVIHTAFNHSGDFFEEVNVEKIALDAVLTALEGSNKKLIITSGSGVLGDTGEKSVDETFPVPWEFPASVRAKVEVACIDAAAKGVHTCVLRLPVLVYGNGQSQFVPALIDTAKRNRVSYYVGDGTNRLSCVHVEDVADLFILALDKAPAGSLYNVANDVPVFSRELSEGIASAAQVNKIASVTIEEASQTIHPFVALLLSMNNSVTGEAAKQRFDWSPGTLYPSLLKDLYNGSYSVLSNG